MIAKRVEIKVRYSTGTHIARYSGVTATSTAGPLQAAEAVLRKVLGSSPLDPGPKTFSAVADVQSRGTGVYLVTISWEEP